MKHSPAFAIVCSSKFLLYIEDKTGPYSMVLCRDTKNPDSYTLTKGDFTEVMQVAPVLVFSAYHEAKDYAQNVLGLTRQVSVERRPSLIRAISSGVVAAESLEPWDMAKGPRDMSITVAQPVKLFQATRNLTPPDDADRVRRESPSSSPVVSLSKAAK